MRKILFCITILLSLNLIKYNKAEASIDCVGFTDQSFSTLEAVYPFDIGSVWDKCPDETYNELKRRLDKSIKLDKEIYLKLKEIRKKVSKSSSKNEFFENVSPISKNAYTKYVNDNNIEIPLLPKDLIYRGFRIEIADQEIYFLKNNKCRVDISLFKIFKEANKEVNCSWKQIQNNQKIYIKFNSVVTKEYIFQKDMYYNTYAIHKNSTKKYKIYPIDRNLPIEYAKKFDVSLDLVPKFTKKPEKKIKKKPETSNEDIAKLEEEKRKIEEEKRKIEEEKRKIAEAKKKQEEEEKILIIGSGTGFFVNDNGHIITNNHVVEICKMMAAEIDGDPKIFKILATDEQNDLALIKGDYINKNFLNLSTKGAVFGEDIVAFGYPLDTELSSSVKLTRGIVSSLSGPKNNISQIQIDAAIQPGNSGGPVLNYEGQVVGVASSGLNKWYMIEKSEYIPENVNFAVAAPTLLSFLKANNVNFGEKKIEVSKTKELAKIGMPSTIQLLCLNTKSTHEKHKKNKKYSDVLLKQVIDFR